ncbi:MAG: hypothetical protein OXC09_04955 [Truepera sp.]|nr:hypothetical protein [Truepera sp.]
MVPDDSVLATAVDSTNTFDVAALMLDRVRVHGEDSAWQGSLETLPQGSLVWRGVACQEGTAVANAER